VILAAGTLAQASFSMTSVALPALGPALRDDYHLSLRQTGVVLAGISADLLGLSLSSAILYGASIAVGSLAALVIVAAGHPSTDNKSHAMAYIAPVTLRTIVGL